MKHYRNTELIQGIAFVAKQLRKEKSSKLSQEEVMNDIKIKDEISVHIGRIETGGNITVSSLSLLCDYYGISLSEFMGRVEDKMREQKQKRKRR